MDAIERRHVELLNRYKCEFIGGRELREVLGYASGPAFRQAVAKKRLPVSTVFIEGRRGRQARLVDIARWMVAVESQFSGVVDGATTPLRVTRRTLSFVRPENGG